jgi:hypothetical protein
MRQDKFDGGVLKPQYCMKKKSTLRRINLT